MMTERERNKARYQDSKSDLKSFAAMMQSIAVDTKKRMRAKYHIDLFHSPLHVPKIKASKILHDIASKSRLNNQPGDHARP